MTDPSLEVLIFKIRVIFVHLVYLLYSVLLWLKLVALGEVTGHGRSELLISMIIWLVVFVVCHLLIAYSALSGRPHKILRQTWLNFPMLVFIILTLGPYGFTLKHMYSAADLEVQPSNRENMTCPRIHGDVVPMYDFILLQMVMPAMLLNFVVYPLPRRAYMYSEYIAIGMEFINAFDTMDMIGDLAFIRHYGVSWEVLFYFSLGVTAVSIAFPIKVESEKSVWKNQFVASLHQSQVDMAILSRSKSSVLEESQNDLKVEKAHYPVRINNQSRKNATLNSIVPSESELPTQQLQTADDKCENKVPTKSTEINEQPMKLKENEGSITPTKSSQRSPKQYAMNLSKTQKKIIKVVMTVIFTDTFFALMRFKIMVEENSAVHGFNMFMKNLILSCLHLSYLLHHVHNLVVIRLFQTV